MPKVAFTANLRRHVECGDREVSAATVREALELVFAETPRLREYILNDNGALRDHVKIFVDGELIQDRRRQSDPVAPHASIYVMQALSGG